MKRLRICKSFLLVLLLVSGMATAAWAQSNQLQSVRSSELNMQLHRAETAWKSGASLLEAKARLDHVLKELPDDLEARTLRAEVLLDMSRPEEALDDAQRAVELAPESGIAHLLLTEAARRCSKLDLAREALREAVAHLDESATQHVRLSWNAALLEELEIAESLARTALALDESEAAAYYQLARVFLQKDQDEEAASVLERGFRAEVLDAAFVERDVLLRRLADHPMLQKFMSR